MTTAREYDYLYTRFSEWVRMQKELDSRSERIRAYNVDFIWLKEDTGKWMLLEEKCRMSEPKAGQWAALKRLDTAIHDPDYCGLHLIQFEKEYPDDGGRIYIDKKEVTKEELIKFLRFGKKFTEKDWLDV